MSQLRADWAHPEVANFLTRYGYDPDDVPGSIAHLQKRLHHCGTFPHEIGLFLGYPLGDVVGFICNNGKNCKCSGPWKVYCNEGETTKQFARFEKCRKVYRKLFQQGRTIGQLTVAA